MRVGFGSPESTPCGSDLWGPAHCIQEENPQLTGQDTAAGHDQSKHASLRTVLYLVHE